MFTTVSQGLPDKNSCVCSIFLLVNAEFGLCPGYPRAMDIEMGRAFNVEFIFLTNNLVRL